MTTELPEGIHPSEVLLEDFMQATNITARQLAADIDGSPSRISDIVSDWRPISADTAVRLGVFFGMDARFWVNLQAQYGMRIASGALQQSAAQRIRTLRVQLQPGAEP
jgi:addiction module HigA family antidote